MWTLTKELKVGDKLRFYRTTGTRTRVTGKLGFLNPHKSYL